MLRLATKIVDKQNNREKIFIGVSWPYANGNIHIGHLAGQNIACDVFARYHRLKGNDVLMVSGTDSHGTPVVFKAEEMGITPEQLAQDSHDAIIKTFKTLGLLYENYTKTTTENHKVVVQNIFSVLLELGYLEEKESEQYFDPKVERFLPDRYVRGTCPECNEENARGDECPACGAYLEPEELLNPYSSLSDATPVLTKTKHFYMNLEKIQPFIETWAGENQHRWRKWVREFTKGWLKEGLKSRAVTRDMKYGIKVPVDGWEEKVIYVWIEAIVGYLSAAVEWADNQGNKSLWQEYWKDPKAKHYYFIAGGNVPFHTIMWPAELTAYNEKYKNKDLAEKYKLPGETSNNPLTLPYDVPANKMLFFKGKKMSKGDNRGITVEDLLDNYSPDIIRYFFTKYAPENNDREYSWKDFIDANNNELVANLGNFINRTLSFIQSKYDGKVPKGKLENDVKEAIEKAFKDVDEHITNTRFIKSIEAVLDLGHFSNKYFNDKEPWSKERDDGENTLYNSIQLVNAIRLLLRPYTPFAIEKLNELLSIENEYNANNELEEKGRVSKFVNTMIFEEIEIGRELKKPEILFEKLEYTEKLKEQDES